MRDESADDRWYESEERTGIQEEGRPINGTATDGLLLEHLSELGNARRFVTQHGNDVRFCPAFGWLVWDGRRWLRDETRSVERLAKATVGTIWTEVQLAADGDERSRISKHALRSERAAAIAAMLKLAESEAAVVVSHRDLDTNPLALNVLNGTIDLRTGDLRGHRREDLITMLAPVTYSRTATAPTWERFLDRIYAGDEELIRFVQRAVGYSLTGETREHVFFLGHGNGANGKSTLLECFRDLLGDYAAQADFGSFAADRKDGPRNDLARLAGARFVAAIEAERGRRFAEAILKQLTGGDTVTARYLYREHFEFRPAFKLWLAANHKPNIRGVDDGIWRRVRLVPFAVTIPESERDGDLPEKLRAELPGILGWAVQGCLDWQRDGLGSAPAVRQATDSYREECDSLAPFLEDRCILNETVSVRASDLYAAFKLWCEDAHERAMSQRSFGMALAERGFQSDRERTGKRVWRGVTLR